MRLSSRVGEVGQIRGDSSGWPPIPDQSTPAGDSVNVFATLRRLPKMASATITGSGDGHPEQPQEFSAECRVCRPCGGCDKVTIDAGGVERNF